MCFHRLSSTFITVKGEPLTRHHADLRVYKGTIDHPDRQKYNLSKVKHWFQINWYCKLQSMQKHILGCWKRDFDKILLTFSNNKSLNWIYGWTRWATGWQPAQFRWVGSLPLNRTWVDSSGVLMTRIANLAMVWVRPGPGLKVTVPNRWWHYCCVVTQLKSILQTTAAHWANLTVKMSIDRLERDFWVYHYLQLADTLKYILKDIFICIIKEQCFDEGESTWRQYKGCQNTINDILGQNE